jgi:hypothetical protein
LICVAYESYFVTQNHGRVGAKFEEDFFDKENILISRRYQLHPTSAHKKKCHKEIQDAHIMKNKKEKK